MVWHPYYKTLLRLWSWWVEFSGGFSYISQSHYYSYVSGPGAPRQIIIKFVPSLHKLSQLLGLKFTRKGGWITGRELLLFFCIIFNRNGLYFVFLLQIILAFCIFELFLLIYSELCFMILLNLDKNYIR